MRGRHALGKILFFCFIVVLFGCEKSSLPSKKLRLDKVTATTAKFVGCVNASESELALAKVSIHYAPTTSEFNIHTSPSFNVTTFKADGSYEIQLKGLKYNTSYNYCLVTEVGSKVKYGSVETFTTSEVILSDISHVVYKDMVTVTGKISGLSEVDEPFFILKSSMSESSLISSDSYSGSEITEIDSDGYFEIQFRVRYSRPYYFAIYYSYIGAPYNGEIYSIEPVQDPYEMVELDMASAVDLSKGESANCYIVSQPGLYKFRTVKGNTAESVGNVVLCTTLWETFGTLKTPTKGDLLSKIQYKDGYIAFEVPADFMEGNALIGAKDEEGNILWSWHIWIVDNPVGQSYDNGAGVMMDRNLGATESAPGDPRSLGLLYQWGRKDPFVGSSEISSYLRLASRTGSKPEPVKTEDCGTVEYSIANPLTFITNYCGDYDDWLKAHDFNLWSSDKTMYDPCPPGWRVPDGGAEGVWAKAIGSEQPFSYEFDSKNCGIDFSGILGSSASIWYPASGFLSQYDGSLSDPGHYGYYWSCDADFEYTHINRSYLFFMDKTGLTYPSRVADRAVGRSVRCQKGN